MRDQRVGRDGQQLVGDEEREQVAGERDGERRAEAERVERVEAGAVLGRVAAELMRWTDWMNIAAFATVVGGLIVFGVVFAMNSSLHSFLVLAFSDDDGVALDVGFYYSANAAGRSAVVTCRLTTRPAGVRTADTPALPYITARGADPAPLFAALAEGVAALSSTDRAALRLRGIVPARPADYLAVPTPPPPAHFGALC